MALGKAVTERVDDDIGAVVGLTPWAMEPGQAVYPGTEVRLDGPRQKPYPVLAYWPTTIARDRVSHRVVVKTAKEWSE